MITKQDLETKLAAVDALATAATDADVAEDAAVVALHDADAAEKSAKGSQVSAHQAVTAGFSEFVDMARAYFKQP